MAGFPVRIENVIDPRFLRISGGLKTTVLNIRNRPVTLPVAMEVYTGVVVPFLPGGFFGDDTTVRDRAMTFLPFKDMAVRVYPRGSIKDVTATASPATISVDEDEAFIGGVDTVASVQLEPQVFGGAKEPLVMGADLAILNGSILRFTYQVTLLVDEAATIDEVDRGAGGRPALR